MESDGWERNGDAGSRGLSGALFGDTVTTAPDRNKGREDRFYVMARSVPALVPTCSSQAPWRGGACAEDNILIRADQNQGRKQEERKDNTLRTLTSGAFFQPSYTF